MIAYPTSVGVVDVWVRVDRADEDGCVLPEDADRPCRIPFLISGKILLRIVKRFRGGLLFKDLTPLYHSTLGSRVITRKKKNSILHVFQLQSPPSSKLGTHKTVKARFCLAFTFRKES